MIGIAMNILSIGILAHNEAAIIDRTIASLADQSILDPVRARALGLDAIEILVVPNGCSDDTDSVSAAALARMPPHVATSVRVLTEAGKSNAWNRFVHDLSRPDAQLLVLMDADIEFGSADVIERLVQRLNDVPSAAVSTDRPVKDYRRKTRLTPLDRLSQRVSEQQTGPRGICGQLYCGRAAALRRIWLPAGLPVEDGFLAAMLLTDGFTRQPDERVIAPVADAQHFYEPLESVSAFIHHEARIIVGSVINAWLFTVLWEAGKDGHAGAFVRRRNDQDPHWVETVCQQERAGRGRWLVPNSFVFGRLAMLRRQPLGRLMTRAPIAVAATLATMPAVLRANAILRRPAARLLW